jgi:hypothetical protein
VKTMTLADARARAKRMALVLESGARAAPGSINAADWSTDAAMLRALLTASEPKVAHVPGSVVEVVAEDRVSRMLESISVPGPAELTFEDEEIIRAACPGIGTSRAVLCQGVPLVEALRGSASSRSRRKQTAKFNDYAWRLLYGYTHLIWIIGAPEREPFTADVVARAMVNGLGFWSTEEKFAKALRGTRPPRAAPKARARWIEAETLALVLYREKKGG